MTSNWIFLSNLVCTWYLVGLIWMVQVVHYNLFDRVGQEQFVQYETDHTRLITPVVGPPMLIELATAAMLVLQPPPGLPRWTLAVGLVAVVVIWLSTVFIQVPCHERLSGGFNAQDYARLVGSNWIRTIAWTARGIIMTYLASRLMS